MIIKKIVLICLSFCMNALAKNISQELEGHSNCISSSTNVTDFTADRPAHSNKTLFDKDCNVTHTTETPAIVDTTTPREDISACESVTPVTLAFYTAGEPENADVVVRREGDNVSLVCELRGDPVPRLYVWHYVTDNYMRSKPERPFTIEPAGPATRSTLVVTSLQASDSGRYMCSVPPFSVSKYILVQSRGPVQCERGAFWCGTRCVLAAYVCDGRRDCLLGEDEDVAMCRPPSYTETIRYKLHGSPPAPESLSREWSALSPADRAASTCVIIGQGNVVNGGYHAVNGNNNVVSGNFHYVKGNGNNVTEYGNVIKGNTNTVSGNHQTVLGNGNNVTGDDNVTKGNTNTVSGNRHNVRGNGNNVSGNNNIVYGDNLVVTGDNKVVRNRYSVVAK